MKIKIFQVSVDFKKRKYLIREIESVAKAKKLNKSLAYFMLIKSLQFNNDFIKEIKRIREKHDISIEGMSCEKTALESLEEHSMVVEVKETPLNSLLDSLEEEAHYLMKFFNHENKNYFYDIMVRAVATIILYNGVLLFEHPNITLRKENVKYGDVTIPEILISIEINTSKRTVINFINDNWDKIKEMQKDLNDELKFKMSERDLIVMGLRKHKRLKLSEILPELDKIYPNNNFNYDQIKASHKNAKDKINNLFKK